VQEQFDLVHAELREHLVGGRMLEYAEEIDL
jgi:hypothetical protein